MATKTSPKEEACDQFKGAGQARRSKLDQSLLLLSRNR